jgi:hypothetical protein
LRGSWFQISPGKSSGKKLGMVVHACYPKKTARGLAQEVECLSSKHEAQYHQKNKNKKANGWTDASEMS